MDSTLAMEVCLAVRGGELEAAEESFTRLLERTPEQELLKAVGDCLLAAVRRQQSQLFHSWLWQARKQLIAAIAVAKQQAAGEFLLQLSFVICDRRLTETQTVLAQLVRRFVSCADAKQSAELLAELLSLAARMARRGWREETAFLLRLYLRELLKEKSARVWQARLLALQLHFVVYARWDGFAKACGAYKELLLLLLLLVRRAGGKKYAREQQERYLLLSLRSLRGIITNAARSAMLDDMEIFRQLYQFFWQLAGENKGRRQQLQLLLQLGICYWQKSLPKTSRKQVRFLEDLLQPKLINADYAALLETI